MVSAIRNESCIGQTLATDLLWDPERVLLWLRTSVFSSAKRSSDRTTQLHPPLKFRQNNSAPSTADPILPRPLVGAAGTARADDNVLPQGLLHWLISTKSDGQVCAGCWGAVAASQQMRPPLQFRDLTRPAALFRQKLSLRTGLLFYLQFFVTMFLKEIYFMDEITYLVYRLISNIH